MSVEYKVQPAHGEFSREMLADMEAYLHRHFFSFQRRDGSYGIAPSAEYRDTVIEEGTQNKVRHRLNTVKIDRRAVTVTMADYDDIILQLAFFVEMIQIMLPSAAVVCVTSDHFISVETMLRYWHAAYSDLVLSHGPGGQNSLGSRSFGL